MRKADVFALLGSDGRPLRPATQASVLAKYSRSPDSAREILAKTTDEDGEKFQQKYDVEWGHSSVGELANIPFCFENVSILASKVLETSQRGAYSEKSTRYQKFSRDSFVEPPDGHPSIRDAANVLYDTYERLQKPFMEAVRELSDMYGAKESVVNARVFDSLRYLLPAGTGTNLAAVWNARDARYMIGELQAHPLAEIHRLGEALKASAHDVAPVFANGVGVPFEPQGGGLGLRGSIKPVLCHVRDPLGQVEEFWEHVLDWYGMSPDRFSSFMGARGKRQVPKVFRTLRVRFDIIMDYGAFRDLQRHRRCDQFVAPLTSQYGTAIPDDAIALGFGQHFVDAYEECLSILRPLQDVGDPNQQYALPLGTNHRSIFFMDVQELYYIAELRTQPQGHISYRRIAYDMFETAHDAWEGVCGTEVVNPMKWCNAIKPQGVEQHR